VAYSNRLDAGDNLVACDEDEEGNQELLFIMDHHNELFLFCFSTY
jgi:hypothetical protein